MTTTKDMFLRLVKPQDDAAQSMGTHLADLHKALKALSFYPQGHPLRVENLSAAHRSMMSLAAGKELVLQVTRKGFVNSTGEVLPDLNPMAQSLARELFIRRIQQVTFLADLSEADLQAFLLILTIDPQQIQSAGGVETLMVQRGITTIWLNEVDLSVIWQKRQELEAANDSAPQVDQGEEVGAATEEEALLAQQVAHEENPEYSLIELLTLMNKETDDNLYLRYARELVGKAEACKAKGDFAPLLPVMEGLMEQADEPARNTIQREYAGFSLEQVVAGQTTDYLLQQLEQRDSASCEGIHRILRRIGTKVVYVIVQRLCVANSLLARKALATAIVRIGPAAVPALVAMLKDDRWYVVRNMVAILGEIRDRECAEDLRPAAEHEDPRVRKETIRSLVNIGGKVAETIIIRMLEDRDTSIVKQAIFSLGVMRSHLAVQPLIEIVALRDLFMRFLPVKREALQALGRIGDRRATPHLLGLLQNWHWFSWAKGEELKIAAAVALGQLGDESALPALKTRMAAGGNLGKACGEAVDNIERLAG